MLKKSIVALAVSWSVASVADEVRPWQVEVEVGAIATSVTQKPQACIANWMQNKA
ncbi:hypothetical protein [Cellvibrio sp.]|uniref:hypothetical protein n=1 Tax=Cellvibrio sp. TaxID=1965322 RepID=UPI0039647647